MIRALAESTSTARITAAYRDLVQVLASVAEELTLGSSVGEELCALDDRLRDLSRELESLLDLDDEQPRFDDSTNRRVAAIEREIMSAAQCVRVLLSTRQAIGRQVGLER